MMKLNVPRLIENLGGPRKVAEVGGFNRTAPYGWIQRGFISQRTMERIKTVWPDLDLNLFFEESDSETNRRCSSGVS